MSIRMQWVFGAGLLALGLGGASLYAGGEKAEEEMAAVEDETPYTMVCETVNGRQECKVDQQTYAGWRTYHGFCAQCHGQDVAGTTFAPALTEIMPRIDRERFDEVVTNGIVTERGAMPAFEGNPNVMPRLDEIYAFLHARTDGLPPGRPERLPRD
jgi:mono/diheme cytochrome c family protein